ncbi:hypothetical protein ACS5PN_11015 [Roseateles sp. NT4]
MSSRRWTVALAVALALVLAFVTLAASAHAFEHYRSMVPAAAAQEE